MYEQLYTSDAVYDASLSDTGVDGLEVYSGNLLQTVSGSDLLYTGIFQDTLLESGTVSGPDMQDEVLGSVHSIDNKLTVIIFLMLFIWCAHHVRNAVRSFTGRRIE